MPFQSEELSYLDNVVYDQGPEATRLHTLDICFRPGFPHGTSKLWIIYIHGGAWRDPDINSTSFIPARRLLSSDSRISAFASLNYRLSPYQQHSQNPSSPEDPARNARHPDHLRDICSALEYLQKRYRFGSHYVLVGHSCGATLAFQNLLSSQFPCQKPCAVLGVEGIYDLPALRDHFKDVPIYQEILAGAFGEDEELWKKASPTHGNLAESWKEGKLVCIAHSKEDSMVDTGQALGMMAALKDSASHGMREDRLLWIEREHDDVWQQGDSLAKSVRFVLDVLETK